MNPDALRDALERWLAGLSPRSVKGYRQALAGFGSRPDAQAHEVFLELAADPASVAAVVAAYAASGPDKANTRRRKLSALSSARRALVRAGFPLPPLAVALPQRDQELEAVATRAADLRAALGRLADAHGVGAKRTAAALALAAVGLRIGELRALTATDLAPGQRSVRVGEYSVPLPPAIARVVARWWSTLEAGAPPFPVSVRTLQRDVAELAATSAPTLSVEGVRRRAILEAYLAGGAHAAAEFARIGNPGDLKRIVLAAGERWVPDQPPNSERIMQPRSRQR